jgi:hypothetical protein
LSAYRVEARNLEIGGTDSAALLRVALDRDRVKVTALTGIAEVRNSQGMLIARILPGTVLQLHATSDAASHLTGIVVAQGDKFFLTDETTKVKVELRGPGLKNLVGKRVQVTGAPVSGEKPAGDASQVIRVAQVAAIGAAAAGSAAAGAGAAAGVSIGTIAIVGGVAAAASVGGLGMAGTFSGSNTVSR